MTYSLRLTAHVIEHTSSIKQHSYLLNSTAANINNRIIIELNLPFLQLYTYERLGLLENAHAHIIRTSYIYRKPMITYKMGIITFWHPSTQHCNDMCIVCLHTLHVAIKSVCAQHSSAPSPPLPQFI